jgi:hypothetical protein
MTGLDLCALVGRRVPGGCDDCHADQTVEQRAPGVYLLVVRHDDTCPAYQAMPTRGNRFHAERLLREMTGEES